MASFCAKSDLHGQAWYLNCLAYLAVLLWQVPVGWLARSCPNSHSGCASCARLRPSRVWLAATNRRLALTTFTTFLLSPSTRPLVFVCETSPKATNHLEGSGLTQHVPAANLTTSQSAQPQDPRKHSGTDSSVTDGEAAIAAWKLTGVLCLSGMPHCDDIAAGGRASEDVMMRCMERRDIRR